jgi:hypothetical protein
MRLLLFSGARLREILHAKWADRHRPGESAAHRLWQDRQASRLSPACCNRDPHRPPPPWRVRHRRTGRRKAASRLESPLAHGRAEGGAWRCQASRSPALVCVRSRE